MTESAFPPATEWTPDWWRGPSPLLLVEPDDWPDETSPRGKSVIVGESEEVPLGSFLFRFRSKGSGALVFCRATDGDLDRAELNRLAYTPAAKWQRAPAKKKAARKKAARKKAAR